MKKIASLAQVAAMIALASAGCTGEQTARPAAPLVAVRVTRPRVAEMVSTLSYLGTVHSEREVAVLARVAGTVVEMPVAEGGAVAVGETIARIHAPELEARLERARADHQYWEERYAVDRRLVEAEALPTEQLRTAQRALTTARTALDEAAAALAKTVELAPLTGVVLRWQATPGQHIAPGQPILVLGNNALEVRAGVVEEDLGRGIAVGVPVRITHASGAAYETAVSEIAPVAQGLARIFTVTAPFGRAGAGRPRRGASVRVDFILERRPQATAVPVEAIVRDSSGESFVFAIRGEIAVRQAVVTGMEVDGLVEVLFSGHGGNGDELIAVSNVGNLADGQRVFAVSTEGR